MSAATVPTYRFESAAQWRDGLVVAVPHPAVLDEAAGTLLATLDALPAAIGAAPEGEPVWIMDGHLRGGDCAGLFVGAVERLVVDAERIWMLLPDAIVAADRRSFQLLETLPREAAMDIAADGQGDLWIATPDGPRRLRSRARRGEKIPTDAGSRIAQVSGRPVLLDSIRARVSLFDVAGRVVERVVILADLRDERGRSFRASDISSGADALLLGGDWVAQDGQYEPGFLYLDAAGEPILFGSWHRARPAMIASAGNDLLALFAEGGRWLLRRFADRSDARARRWLTPVLESDTLEGRWLSAEVRARLPEGATLSLRFAATPDETLRLSIAAEIGNVARPASARLARIDSMLRTAWSREMVYSGERHDGPVPLESFTFPLHEAKGHLLWVEISLAPGEESGPTDLSQLAVRHDGRALIDDLPAIYRGPNGDGDGTLARLVGVMDATVQDIDRLIATLGDWLDPERAPDRWLGRIAAMLGIPFDVRLPIAMQRSLVGAAAPILGGRGTRDGLLALLRALFPGRPVRVEDRSLLLAPMTLGGGGFGGSRLPAMLSGASRRVPRLNAGLVLGRTGLCPADPCGPLRVSAPPEVLVTIPATAREQRRHGAAIARMIETMVPATVRLRIRWTRWSGALALGDDLISQPIDPQPLRMGDGEPLGRVRIGGRAMPRLVDGGLPAAHRLM